jgi:DNA-directed RNA polymerase specialized sigma24 family protein
VVTARDAQLILDTRIAGRSLREAAQRLGLRYETAKKRRQRAEARWATWWTSGEMPVALRRTAGRPRREEVA